MEFRLLYRGPLHGNGGIKEKHDIRRQLHRQLAELWKQQPLVEARDELLTPGPPYVGVHLEGFVFAPLVSSRVDLICDLDILFLRPGAPGKVITQGGDIDNRLKTLFDALRVPKSGELPTGAAPQGDEAPFFYCVLEDDALIAGVRVMTDRLLEPHALPNQVTLVLHVVTKQTRTTWANIGL